MQGLLGNHFLKCWSHRLSCSLCHTIPAGNGAHGEGASWTPCLEAIARRKTRRGAALYRAQGLASAVVYDNQCQRVRSEGQASNADNDLLVYLKERQVSELLVKMGRPAFMSTVLVLNVCSWLKSEMESFTERVLPRTLNFDEYGTITNLRLVRAPRGVKLKLNSPLVFLGDRECLGIEKGGCLRKYYLYLPFICDADLLPPLVEVDISKLDIGDKVLIGDVKTDVKLHPDLDPSAPICEIVKGE